MLDDSSEHSKTDRNVLVDAKRSKQRNFSSSSELVQIPSLTKSERARKDNATIESYFRPKDPLGFVPRLSVIHEDDKEYRNDNKPSQPPTVVSLAAIVAEEAKGMYRLRTILTPAEYEERFRRQETEMQGRTRERSRSGSSADGELDRLSFGEWQ